MWTIVKKNDPKLEDVIAGAYAYCKNVKITEVIAVDVNTNKEFEAYEIKADNK